MARRARGALGGTHQGAADAAPAERRIDVEIGERGPQMGVRQHVVEVDADSVVGASGRGVSNREVLYADRSGFAANRAENQVEFNFLPGAESNSDT